MRAKFDYVKQFLRRFTKPDKTEEAWPSLVLLLKEYRPLSDEQLLQLADKCYGMRSPEGRISPEIVSNTKVGRVLRVQFFFLHIPEENARYEVEGRETSEIRQRPWDEHTAWRSVDFPKQKGSNPAKRPEEYMLIFVLITQLWDENCLALYVPEHGITVPNLGGWKESLIWAGKNGSNLDFLKTTSSPAKS
jgi:hypothetical protein